MKSKTIGRKFWKEFSEETWPLCIEEGVLIIGVSDNYLLQELNHRYLNILEKIKKELKKEDSEGIKALKFVFYRKKSESLRKPFYRRGLKEEEINFLKEFCESLPDKELSQSFLRVIKYFASNKRF